MFDINMNIFLNTNYDFYLLMIQYVFTRHTRLIDCISLEHIIKSLQYHTYLMMKSHCDTGYWKQTSFQSSSPDEGNLTITNDSTRHVYCVTR